MAQRLWNSVDTEEHAADRGVSYKISNQPRVATVRPDQIWTVEMLNYWSTLTRMLRDYVKMSQPSQTSATRERMLRKHKLKADQLVGIVRHSGGIQDFWREDCVGSMSCLGLKYAVGMLPQIHVAMQQRGAAM